MGQAEKHHETLYFQLQDLDTHFCLTPNPLTAYEKFKPKHDVIRDVRGKGSMVGFELVKDRNPGEPANNESAQVLERSKELALLLDKSG